MLKPASAKCNLRCGYCFYLDTAENRTIGDRGFMTKETADALIEKALRYTHGAPLTIVLQGGEPLLWGQENLAYFLDGLGKKNLFHSDIRVSVQTNGTLITKDLATLFAEHEVLVGVSLDGTELDNALRTDTQNNPSFSQVRNGIEHLKNAQADFNLLTVVTRQNAKNIQTALNFLATLGTEYIQLIDCVPPFLESTPAPFLLNENEYLTYLTQSFLWYAERFFSPTPIRMRRFDNLVRLVLGTPAEQCGMNGHCTHQVVAEGDGTLYPCDFYCTDQYELGNIHQTDFETLSKNQTAITFINDSLAVPKPCKACNFFQLCKHGCKRYHYPTSYCRALKTFFAQFIGTLEQMAQHLLRQKKN